RRAQRGGMLGRGLRMYVSVRRLAAARHRDLAGQQVRLRCERGPGDDHRVLDRRRRNAAHGRFLRGLYGGRHLRFVRVGVVPPRISVSDVRRAKGAAGRTKAFVFTVTVTGPTNDTVTVDYATHDGTATAGGKDYSPTTGTLTFVPVDSQPQETSQSLTVTVN